MLWALAVGVVDYRQHRVPNLALLLALLLTLPMLAALHYGPLGMALPTSAAGALAGLMVTLPAHLMRKLGAGDVKYAAVIGLLCGLQGLAQALLVAGLVLGAMTLWLVLRLGPTLARSQKIPAAVALSAGLATFTGMHTWL